MAAFQAQGLQALKQRILQHWQNELRAAGDRAGAEGRARILVEIDAMSRDNINLTVADLMMLADLMLVEAANQALTGNKGRVDGAKST